MSVSILLFRAVNIGGPSRLPMADLRHIAISAGAGAARSYRQSGNLVVSGACSIDAMARAIETVHGFRPSIVLRTRDQWEHLVAAVQPRLSATAASLHVLFFPEPLEQPAGELARDAAPNEWVYSDSLHACFDCPNGLTASHAVRHIDRLSGGRATARDWRTVCALLEIARAF